VRLSLLGLAALLLFAPGQLGLALEQRTGPVRTDQDSRAGLAIRFDDSTLVTRCIELDGQELTGSELLARSGLDIVIDSTHGGGITVCKIEGTGCDYPVEACFCQCMGNGPCGYWNYYYREPGQVEWVYSPLGALIHQVTPGSAEAWVWGDGHTPPERALDFESICGSSPALTPTGSAEAPSPTPAAALSQSAGESAALTPSPSPAAHSSPVPTPLPSPEQQASEPGEGDASDRPPSALSRYWPFGLMLLALAAVAAYLRAGRRL
jgi:hypothetical protein